MHIKVAIAVLQTKVINCNSANKSCLFQVMHTKAIAALTQFCDFFVLSVAKVSIEKGPNLQEVTSGNLFQNSTIKLILKYDG